MKAYKYTYSYCTDLAHMMYTSFEEIYIPAHNFAFNLEHNQLNLVRTDKPRNMCAGIFHFVTIKKGEKLSMAEAKKLYPDTMKGYEDMTDIPDEPTPIKEIEVDESLVNELLSLLALEDKKDKIKDTVKQYLKT